MIIKKNLLSVSLCLLFSCGCFFVNAQDAEEPITYTNEWGLNVTGFANQFLSFNSNGAPAGPYLITYKKIKGPKAFRLGFGVAASFSDGSSENSSVPFTENQFEFNIRLGYEKHHEIYKRWLFTTGFDGLLGFDYAKFESNNNFDDGEQKSRVFQIGLGPVLGVHYRINKRISIGTESSVYLTLNHSKDKFSDGFNGSEDTETSSIVRLNIAPPLALYFSLRI